jgi:hypothetical protein
MLDRSRIKESGYRNPQVNQASSTKEGRAHQKADISARQAYKRQTIPVSQTLSKLDVRDVSCSAF